MGIAALQARFLSITSRISNLEYATTACNTSLLSLSQQASDQYKLLLGEGVPSPPQRSNYTSTRYKGTTSDGTAITITSTTAQKDETYNIQYYKGDDSATIYNLNGVTVTASENSGISSIDWTNEDGSVETVALTATVYIDENAYQEALVEYQYKKDLYEQSMDEYERKREEVTRQETQIKIIKDTYETELEALKTERDTIKETLKKNVENSFKLFA